MDCELIEKVFLEVARHTKACQDAVTAADGQSVNQWSPTAELFDVTEPHGISKGWRDEKTAALLSGFFSPQ
jgi:hypothetical protein